MSEENKALEAARRIVEGEGRNIAVLATPGQITEICRFAIKAAEVLEACAADWKSPPCTAPEGAIYLYQEFVRRAELARAALKGD